MKKLKSKRQRNPYIRPCKRCGELFKPDSRYSRFCKGCNKNWRGKL